MRSPHAAIIGGTGLDSLQGLQIEDQIRIDTPFGETSGPLSYGTLFDVPVMFLSRHGEQHSIPPHRVNYRANIHALHQVGISNVIAVAAVGGIRAGYEPGQLMIPDQLIDYTYGRSQTYFDDLSTPVTHIDFTRPYCESLRETLIRGAAEAALAIVPQGVYGVTQGPRLETAAEIDRLERDGCDIVGMTGMPEAALARELEMCYACCAVCANRAAGRGAAIITMAEIQRTLTEGMARVRRLLEATVRYLD